MKKSNLIPVFIAGFLILTGLSVHAAPLNGGNSGGGGDFRCSEYSDMMGEVALALNNLGQKKISQTLSVVNVAALWEIKRALKCIPVHSLDRQARSNPATRTTQLLVGDWEQLTTEEKLRLVVHELSVLAQYEGDGEYFISRKLVQILKTETKISFGSTAAKQTLRNADGSITFVSPTITDGDGTPRSVYGDANGFCYFLGFPGLVSEGSYTSAYARDAAETMYNGTIVTALIRADGSFSSYDRSLMFFSSVTCKPREKSGQ